MNIFWSSKVFAKNVYFLCAHDLSHQTVILLVNHQIDKVVFAEILLSHCIIPLPVPRLGSPRQYLMLSILIPGVLND